MYFFEIWNTINFVMPSFCYALLQSDVFPFKLRGYILYTYKFYKLLANVGAKSFLNGPLFSLFSVFSNITFFTTNQCENMSIQYPVPDSNQQPHEHESSPITTRPGLLLTFNVSIKTCSSFFNLFPYGASDFRRVSFQPYVMSGYCFGQYQFLFDLSFSYLCLISVYINSQQLQKFAVFK